MDFSNKVQQSRKSLDFKSQLLDQIDEKSYQNLPRMSVCSSNPLSHIPLNSKQQSNILNRTSSIQSNRGSSIFQSMDMSSTSQGRSPIINFANIKNQRSRNWDIEQDYKILSPFLSDLLEDRDKYEEFLNGQQQVYLRNEIDAEIVSYIIRKPIKSRFEIEYVKRSLRQIDVFGDTLDLFNTKESENRLLSQLGVQFFPPNNEVFSQGKYYNAE